MIALPNLLPKPPRRHPVRDPLSPLALDSFGSRLAVAEAFWRESCASGASVPDLPLDIELEDETDLPAFEFVLQQLDALRPGPPTGVARDVQPTPTRAGAAQFDVGATGRLLLCELNVSIGDGVSEAAAGGYIDDRDLPPWPTWLIAYARRGQRTTEASSVCLVAWVPEDRVEAVERGINANRCGCLSWLEDRDEGLGIQLRSAGFTALLPALPLSV